MSNPVGPYTPAVWAGPWLVCSGQVGARPGPSGPELVAGGFEAQVRQALANVEGLLVGQGLQWAHVVKTTVYLTDIDAYAAFNAVYVEVLGDHRPARALVAVAALPLGAQVEVEAWAYAGGDAPR
ncbi:MAG TPA: RidA family protein [Acidimicrobiales bacterium]|nr:RidA family protein [Acidimicrobiales bacterium]